MHSIFGRSIWLNRAALLQCALLLTLLIIPTIARAQASALQFIPITPCRALDSRTSTGLLAGGATHTFDLTKSSCGIPASAVAYALNVTVVPSGGLEYLTLWPAGQPRPNVSTLNSRDGRVKANAAITAVGTGGISAYASNSTHLILDINGYFVPAGTSSALQFFPVTPCRVADTRNGGGGTISGGSSRSFTVQGTCGVPSTAQAYSLNITAVPTASLSYLTAWPTGQTQPNVSTLNAPTGTVTANAAIVPAGGSGAVSIYMSNASDVVIDVNGYFAPAASGGLSFFTATECRVVDTRFNGWAPFNGMLAVPVQDSSCAPPGNAGAYVMNATVIPFGGLNSLVLWADGTTKPTVSTLNAQDGAITSNMAIVSNVMGTTDAFSSSGTQMILDLSGYFAP